MNYPPEIADEEIASLKLARDIESLKKTSGPSRHGWEFRQVSNMHWIVRMFGTRKNGQRDEYWVKLGAEYYDAAGPTVLFVDPDGKEVKGLSPWLPKLNPRPSWIAIHPDRNNKVHIGQLVCFSFNAFYEFTHSPPHEDLRWKQGVHTVAATLYSLQKALSQEHYECRLS